MSRRDMIIIAVLANIGVLAFLFMLAFRTDDEKVAEPTEITYTLVQEKPTEIDVLAEAEVIKPETDEEGDNTLDENGTPPNQDEDTIQFTEAELAPETTAPKPENPPEELPIEDTVPKKMVEITVKKGDALEKIARANNTSVEAIMKASQLKSDKLKIGQVLQVPVNTKSTRTKTASTKLVTANSSDPQYYTIKSGDNPWKIAKQFHLKLDELLKLNNLDETSARNLKIGDKVRVQ